MHFSEEANHWNFRDRAFGQKRWIFLYHKVCPHVKITGVITDYDRADFSVLNRLIFCPEIPDLILLYFYAIETPDEENHSAEDCGDPVA